MGIAFDWNGHDDDVDDDGDALCTVHLSHAHDLSGGWVTRLNENGGN